jgi:phosphoribosylanthranilate isomerase
MTRIKICCIKNIDEANLAIRLGVSALGLVSEMPSGPGVITEEEIADIVKHLPPYIGSNLLTCKTEYDQIAKQLLKCKTNTVQIVDRIGKDVYTKLRDNFPSTKIIQVIHVSNEDSIKEAVQISAYVDGILLDSGNQNLKIKVLGGTGKVHDWTISKKIRESISVPLILAGGLNSENVAVAINAVKPYAVDVCSGVRKDDKLDETKLLNFIREVKDEN